MSKYNHLTAPTFKTSLPLRLAFLGAFAMAFGFYFAPARTWPNLLLDGFYFLSLAVSALFFLATQRLSGARWSATLRRVPEAMMSAVPVGAVLMLVVFFGRHWIYPWANGSALEELHIGGRGDYLQVPFVFVRMLIVLVLWTVFAWIFRRTSLAQDRGNGLVHHNRLNQISAVFMVVFALSFTAGSFDWLISLEPSWFSTIYAIYVFAGCFVVGLAAITLAVVILRERFPAVELASEDQLHDLGKLLFAFSTFWAYIWLSQYLLIWYGNIPEEVTHYVTRTNGPWLPLFALNLTLNWIAPFVLLLSQHAKRSPRRLKIMSIVLLCGHWLDLYLLIIPATSGAPKFGPLEILLAAGYAGLFAYVFFRVLANAPLVPVNDPLIEHENGLSVETAQPALPGVQQ